MPSIKHVKHLKVGEWSAMAIKRTPESSVLTGFSIWDMIVAKNKEA